MKSILLELEVKKMDSNDHGSPSSTPTVLWCYQAMKDWAFYDALSNMLTGVLVAGNRIASRAADRMIQDPDARTCFSSNARAYAERTYLNSKMAGVFV
jgi:hypothetical protein